MFSLTRVPFWVPIFDPPPIPFPGFVIVFGVQEGVQEVRASPTFQMFSRSLFFDVLSAVYCFDVSFL